MLDLHQYFGVASLGLVFFRILWGFFGTFYSRFTSFNLSIVDALSQFSKTNNITSIRTPIGCYSTIIFMMVLLLISVSGLFSSDDILYDAPLSFLTPNLTSDWTYIHNILHYFLYTLIGIHILAILYYQIVKKMKMNFCPGANPQFCFGPLPTEPSLIAWPLSLSVVFTGAPVCFLFLRCIMSGPTCQDIMLIE